MKTGAYEEYYSKIPIQHKPSHSNPTSRNTSFENAVDQSSSSFLLPFNENSSESRNFIRSYKQKIILAIDSAVKTFNIQKSESRKLRTFSVPLNKKRTNSMRSLQQRNIERIKEEENNQLEEAFSEFRASVEQNKAKQRESAKKQRFFTISQKSKDIQEFLRKKSLDQSENSVQIMESLSKKLEKSAKQHFFSIERKRKIAGKNSLRAQSVNQTFPDESFVKLEKIISKNKNFEKWKKKYLKAKNEKFEKKKKEISGKLDRIKTSNFLKEKNQIFKSLEIENRFRAYEELIESQKKKVEIGQKEKFEKLRIKEAGIFRNFLRNEEKQ
jgi:hypothetical protein